MLEPNGISAQAFDANEALSLRYAQTQLKSVAFAGFFVGLGFAFQRKSSNSLRGRSEWNMISSVRIAKPFGAMKRMLPDES